MTSPILQAIKQICEEKGLSQEMVISSIESALAAAYRKDFGEPNQNIKVKFNPETGSSRVFDVKTVVENDSDREYIDEETGEKKIKKFNPKTEITLKEAKKIKKDVKIGDILKLELEIPAAYGRMAAQTAKQVIIQKIREAERESLYEEFKSKEGEIISGIIQRKLGKSILVDLGKVSALFPLGEQIEGEKYLPGRRFKFYVLSVKKETKGPEITLSRAHPEMIKKLFEAEIPEVVSGIIEIKNIAREAGSRAKVAVFSHEKNIDPIGSCVGQRGARIQTIIAELGGEKVDIIEFKEDPMAFVANSLSPAKVISVELDKKTKTATVTVREDQLSLAIGKEGQNVRLAAKLTGWKINIVKETASGEKERVEIPQLKEEIKEKKK